MTKQQNYNQQLEQEYLNISELILLDELKKGQDRIFKPIETLTIDEGFI